MSPVLSKPDILSLLKQKPPLVECCVNLEEQVQPNGIDLTLREITRYDSKGQIAAKNSDRVISNLAPLPFDKAGYVDLTPGPYLVTYNEIVNLPKNLMALVFPRSSLLRCGVTVYTAVWDAGYSGRAQSLLEVHNPLGFRLQQNARIVQLIFMTLSGETEGYQGKYQRENI